MAETTFRVNLNAAEIPFLTSLLGRTVIIPGLDQNSVKSAQFAGSGESLDQGIPQILYAENIMPTDFGVQSVGYTKIINEVAVGIGPIFDRLMTLRDIDENSYLFAPASGYCWVYDAAIGAWQSNFQIAPPFTGTFVSKSNINGRTFICFEKRGFYEYSAAIRSMVPVTFAGLVIDEILGICNSGNYNIAHTVDTILWSSLTDETDFVASLSTGAGSAIPQDLKGPIVCVLPISGGMIIYTTKNVVVGLATNNARYPFNFKEVANAGGIKTSEHASYENGLGTHYAWTSAGLQKITTSAAETVFPAATDFLAGRRLETFDPSSLTFTTLTSISDLKVKLTYLESRYLVISYGIVGADKNTLDYCLIFDTVLKRWGKLKIKHVDCFDYTYPNLSGDLPYKLTEGTYADYAGISYSQLKATGSITPIPKKSIGFLQSDGSVWLLNFEFNAATASVLLLGKYQLTRTSVSTLQKIEVENPEVQEPYAWDSKDPIGTEVLRDVAAAANSPYFDLRVLPSQDGRNFQQSIAPKLVYSSYNILCYGCRETALSHTLALSGAFHVRSIIMTLTKSGKPRVAYAR